MDQAKSGAWNSLVNFNTTESETDSHMFSWWICIPPPMKSACQKKSINKIESDHALYYQVIQTQKTLERAKWHHKHTVCKMQDGANAQEQRMAVSSTNNGSGMGVGWG